MALPHGLVHCISTVAPQPLITDISIMNDVICSDHLPLCISINCEITPCMTCHFLTSRVYWQSANDNGKYSAHTLEFVSAISISYAALMCNDANCNSHRSDIECFIMILYPLWNNLLPALSLHTQLYLCRWFSSCHSWLERIYEGTSYQC